MNCVYVNDVLFDNDVDFFIDNIEIVDEDDDDCVSIMVEGDNMLVVEKGFSLMFI